MIRVNRSALQDGWRNRREDFRSGLLAWAALLLFLAGIGLVAIVIGK